MTKQAIFSRQARDGKTISGYAVHKDDHVTLEIAVGEEIVFSGQPSPMPRKLRGQVPAEFTALAGKFPLRAVEVESYDEAKATMTVSLRWRPEGHNELHEAQSKLSAIEARLEGTGPDDGGPQTAKLYSEASALRERIEALIEQHEAAALYLTAEQQRDSASWQDNLGKADAAETCLRILRQSEGNDIDAAREALAARRTINPWM